MTDKLSARYRLSADCEIVADKIAKLLSLTASTHSYIQSVKERTFKVGLQSANKQGGEEEVQHAVVAHDVKLLHL